jgi:hypothetical protein
MLTWNEASSTMKTKFGKREAWMYKQPSGDRWILYVSYYPRIDANRSEDAAIVFSDRDFPSLASALGKCEEILNQEWEMTK